MKDGIDEPTPEQEQDAHDYEVEGNALRQAERFSSLVSDPALKAFEFMRTDRGVLYRGDCAAILPLLPAGGATWP